LSVQGQVLLLRVSLASYATAIFEILPLAVSSRHPAEPELQGVSMSQRKRRRIQFVSDALVQEIVDGIKTASIVDLGDVDVADGDYDDLNRPGIAGESNS